MAIDPLIRRALQGALLLVPAATLCGSGVAGMEPPPVLVDPVFVLGGLAGGALLNLRPILHIEGERRDGLWMALAALRVRGRWPNLAVVGSAACLGGLILGYMAVEHLTFR